MRKSIRDWFYCTRSERNGTVVLAVLMVLTVVFNGLYPVIMHHPREFFVPLSSWQFAPDSNVVESQTTTFQATAEEKNASALFPFDPNHLPVSEWQKLGLSERQANMIHRYEAAGGKFETKKDLSKIYAVTPALFEKWYPFIQLPDEKAKSETTENNLYTAPEFTAMKGEESLQIELNSADTMSLRKIRGVGPFFARQIIRYRDQLGGFFSHSQLSEVWKMRTGLADTIADFVTVDTSLVHKIFVNTTDVETLIRHPYITTGQARCIVAYREKHGIYQHWDEFKRAALLDEETFEKIKPYIALE